MVEGSEQLAKYEELQKRVDSVNSRIATARAKGDLLQQEAAKLVTELHNEFGVTPAKVKELITKKQQELEQLSSSVEAEIINAEQILSQLEGVK